MVEAERSSDNFGQVHLYNMIDLAKARIHQHTATDLRGLQRLKNGTAEPLARVYQSNQSITVC